MTRAASILRHRIEIPIVAVIAIVLVAIGSGTTSIWYDEAATIVSATRTWPELWAMLHTVDAVHGLYYAIIHVWFDLVGYSPFTLRLPSAIISGGTVVLTMLLASRFGTRGFALLAGVVLVTIPRFTWAGMEGRSYAMTALLAVALTLLLTRALDATGRARTQPTSRWVAIRPWLAYALLALFSVGIFVYLALLVVAHAVTVLVLVSSGTLNRRHLIAFGSTAVPLGLVSIPFLLEVSGQSGQVGWLSPISQGTVGGILVTQFSPMNTPFAVFTWMMVLGGIATVIVARRASTPRARAARTLLAWILPWLIVPTVALMAVSVLITPLYSPRYLTFLVPALAIALAGGIVGLGRLTRRVSKIVLLERWPRMRLVPWTALASVAGVLVLVLLSAPSYVGQRQTQAKQNSSWSKAAWRVSEITSTLPAAPGGSTAAVAFGSIAGHPTATARVVEYSYPWAFTSLDDVGLTGPIGSSDRLWETSQLVDPKLLAGHDRVILVTSERNREENQVAVEGSGFHEVDSWNYSKLRVILYER